MLAKIKGLVRRILFALLRPVIVRVLAPEVSVLKTICAELKLETEILSQEVSELRGQAKLSGLSAVDRQLVSLYKQVTPEK